MEYKRIEELTTVITGGTPSTAKPEYWNEGSIPWLQSGCCQNCDVLSAEKYITQEGYDNSSTRMMPPETVMIALTGATAGKVGYLKFNACGNQSITGILPCDSLNQRFLYYYLLSKREQILADCIGGAQPHISQGYVKNIRVPVPDLAIQNDIVDRLTKLNSVLSIRERQLGLLDEIVKARFVEMFGTVDNNVFDYPVVRLGDYAKLQGGYAFKSKDFVDEGIPLVQIGNVNKDYLDWEVINAVPEEFLDRYREFSLCDGDLVIAMTRPIIKSLNSVKIAKVSKSDVPCLLNQRVGRFVLSDSLDKLFLETLCKSDDFKDYVERMSGNSLQPNISSKQVEDYMIILPPIDLQERFAEFVKQVDKSKVVVQKGLEETQNLFNSLMQQYFG